jgi:hypothetical protein
MNEEWQWVTRWCTRAFQEKVWVNSMADVSERPDGQGISTGRALQEGIPDPSADRSGEECIVLRLIFRQCFRLPASRRYRESYFRPERNDVQRMEGQEQRSPVTDGITISFLRQPAHEVPISFKVRIQIDLGGHRVAWEMTIGPRYGHSYRARYDAETDPPGERR